LGAALARVAVQHDVFKHHDSIINHKADGGGKTAKSPSG